MEMELGKIFVGGISWDTNEDRLREYFQAFGEVVEAVIMKDRTTGRARGFGFVVFADPSIAERVVMEKHVIDGRTVEAKKAIPRDDQYSVNKSNSSTHGSPGLARTKKIFVGGLASTVTESDFKNYFDQFGTITDVVVMYDHNTQRPRGFGFITYDSEEAVDKVLIKTFHELNGKMVEVKRAVPKELSPSPSRSPLGGQSYLRVSGLLNGYSQGYNPASVGAYGLRMDGRYSPVTVNRSGFSPLGPSGYGMGMNFEPGLSPSYGGGPNISSYVRGPNSYYSGNSNRYGSSIGYGGGNGIIGSHSSPNSRSLWGNESLNYPTNSANSSSFMGFGGGSTALSSFGNGGAIWGSSPIAGQGRGASSAYSSGNISYNNDDIILESGGRGYVRNGGATAGSASSYAAPNDGYDGVYGSLYGDSTWRSSLSNLERSGSFGYGLGRVASDVTSNNSASYIDSYNVTGRQQNSGIPAKET